MQKNIHGVVDTTTVEGRGPNKPLDVTFDERIGQWIVACGDGSCSLKLAKFPMQLARERKF